MRKFIIKLLLVIVPLVIIALPLEYVLRQIPNDYMYKNEYLDNYSDDIEVLILGGSHSYYGINPDYFTAKTFNAGNVSQPLNIDLKILEKYQNNFKNLKTIIIPMSYPSLWAKLDGSPESWRIKNYVIYQKIDYKFSLQNYMEIFGNKFNVNIRRLRAYHIRGEDLVTSNKLGWGADNTSSKAKDLDKTGKEAALRHLIKNPTSKSVTNIFDENISILNSIISWGAENNVNIILLTTPVYKTYVENTNARQLEKTIEISNQLAEKYNNCIYFNFLNDTSFVAGDYYDADHLNEKGAEKFSILVNNIVQSNSGVLKQRE